MLGHSEKGKRECCVGCWIEQMVISISGERDGQLLSSVYRFLSPQHAPGITHCPPGRLSMFISHHDRVMFPLAERSAEIDEQGGGQDIDTLS